MKSLKKKPIQMYIEKGQDIVLQNLSKARRTSKAAIIRESIEKYINELPIEDDPGMNLIGLGHSGKGDISKKHDEYLAKLKKR